MRASRDGVRSAVTAWISARVSQVDDLEGFLSGVEPRQPQQILHHPLHAQRVSHDDGEKALGVFSARVAVRQRLDVAADRGQRRAQLV